MHVVRCKSSIIIFQKKSQLFFLLLKISRIFYFIILFNYLKKHIDF